MNIIYITNSSKKKFINETKEVFSEEGDVTNEELIFHKKNVKIISVLDTIYPHVLSLIINDYSTEIIKIDYSFNVTRNYPSRLNLFSYALKIDIISYNFEIDIDFVERPWTEFYKNETVIGSNFIMQPTFNDEYFGISGNANPFKYFNKFMLKYYNKKKYFDNYFYNNKMYSTKNDYEPIYENCKELKYCIIITKILTDIIQYM